MLIESPSAGDGPGLWRLARDAGGLDLNSPYAYLLWCRDFADTSVVARAGADIVGFITGYRRPEADETTRGGGTLFVWQVAVDPAARGQRIGVRMLDAIGDAAKRLGCRYVEATVTPDNEASARMFASFARAHGAPLERSDGFGSALFPDNHQPEDLIRIGPL
ncbi:MAG: diaminobutyrate acetyltransferase [Nocardiopsaceae bacterium]|nr:diaminobutyrate acetyltransferase [Nocardiopsaceae bacterium]